MTSTGLPTAVLWGRTSFDDSVTDVEAVKRRHERRLLETPGVTGVGIGRRDGQDCIRIYVADDSPKVLSAIPTSVEDVPVEVVVSGPFKAR